MARYSLSHTQAHEVASYPNVTPIPEEFLRKVTFVSLKEELPCRTLTEGSSEAASEEEKIKDEGATLGSSHVAHQRHPMKKKDRRRQRREQWLQS